MPIKDSKKLAICTNMLTFTQLLKERWTSIRRILIIVPGSFHCNLTPRLSNEHDQSSTLTSIYENPFVPSHNTQGFSSFSTNYATKPTRNKNYSFLRVIELLEPSRQQIFTERGTNQDSSRGCNRDKPYRSDEW